MSYEPKDEAARQRTRKDHGASLVLQAGAGTGKTTLLIDRIESLVRTGAAGLLDIAAVTFTENAAATMKLRLRERLEKARVDPEAQPAERERAGAALDVLERAQVSTIHALCAAILQERPLECGVIPGFRVADDAETDALFAAAWDEWLAERLDAGDPVLSEAIRNEIPLTAEGEYGQQGSLRGLARTLLEQRDLDPLVSDAPVDPEVWRAELVAKADRAKELIKQAKPGDTLAPKLAGLVVFTEGARHLQGDDLGRYLAGIPKVTSTIGQQPKWPSPAVLAEARELAAWTGEAGVAWTAARGSSLHARLVLALLGVIERYEQKKRAQGVLDFLDLLLRARDALRDRESVRRCFRQRFKRVLIDEFQDTDPLQVEIAKLLTAEAPGGLVIVGDAKQSIYRFRRAEVSLLTRMAGDAAGRPGHAVLHLTQNFRSRPAILRFVNRAFARLIEASEENGQPAYEPIDAPPDLAEGPAVIALRFRTPELTEVRADLLRAEGEALAAWAMRAADGGYEVREPGNGQLRKSQAGDMMILAPRLTQIRYLEAALEQAGLRFTVEGGKSFFSRQEVHEALAVLRAIDDRSDRVSLVAALRSSFFGVSDTDIAAYALAGGRLAIGEADAERPGAVTVGPALALLAELHWERLHCSVPALIERLYERTGVLAALSGTRRGLAQIANLEKTVALARQAGDLGILTLRGFARLLAERIQGVSEEPDLPTTRPGDLDTIRILTIHKAKGLEAPIVVLYDQAANLRYDSSVISLWEEGKVAVGFREGFRPPDWKRRQARDRARAWAEGRRLLYVACTRARDWLVVPRAPAEARPGNFWRDLGPFLDMAPEDVLELDAETLPQPGHEPALIELDALAAAEGGDPAGARWEVERKAQIEAAAARPYLPISALRAAAREAPPPVFTPSGTGGRDFGRLVHRLLEWIPFDDDGPGRAAAMAEALAPTFGLDAAAAARAAEAVTRALALPVMQRAPRAARLWREVPLWFPLDGELIEGVVDLVFEEEGALVVVDYKTDQIAPDQAFAQAAHHAPQLRLYARGLTQATGLPVKERLVLFTTLGQTVPV